MAAVKTLVLVTLVLSLWPQGSRGDQEPQDVLECPVWFIPERDMCMCGDSINGRVHCSNESGHNASLAIAPYTCMTYDEELNTTLFGASPYCNLPHPSRDYYPLHITSNTTAFNHNICAPLNRKGRLCGECRDGYMPVHCGYPQKCVKSDLLYKGLFPLFVMNILPTTIFFFGVLAFRVDVISPPLSSFVLFNQVLYYYFSMYIDPTVKEGLHSTIAKLITSFYGLLSLKYFSELLPYACFVGSNNNIANLPIYCFQSLYPFLLVVVSYICIECHARNYRPFVILWRPFEMCFAKLRRSWDIKRSVLNSLVTFLVLSYCELGTVSSINLQNVQLFTPNGTALPTLYVYFSPSIKYFHGEHLPAGIVASVCFFFMTLFPLLLFLYPFKWVQRLLEKLRLRRHGLQAFMDIFQGHFKNGTGGTKDWRPFSAIYFFARILFGISYGVGFWLSLYIPLAVVIIIVVAMPYKRQLHNTMECLIFAYYTALLYLICVHSYSITPFANSTLVIIYIFYALPGVVFIGYLVFLLLKNMRCASLCKNMLAVAQYRDTEGKLRKESVKEEELPFRIAHSSSYDYRDVSH